MTWQIHQALAYGHTGTASYTIDRPAISLHICHYQHYQVNDTDIDVVQPFILLATPGMHIYFRDEPGRRSYSVQLDCEDIRAGDEPLQALLRFRDTQFSLPCVTPLSEHERLTLEPKFLRLTELYNSPTLRGELRSLYVVQELLGFIMDKHDTSNPSVASALKSAIDNDLTHQYTIAQLCEQLNYSSNHLRLLFSEEYGTTPVAYRNRMRLIRAAGLLRNSRYITLQHIAKELGFKHLSHFSREFKQAYGMPPKRYMLQYKQKREHQEVLYGDT